MYLVLHVITGQILINPVYKIPWAFSAKHVAEQLVKPDCPANLINMFGQVLEYNKITKPVSLDEFEIIYREGEYDPNSN